MMTDPIADLLTRMRNAQRVKHSSVVVKHSKANASILGILKERGFIRDFQEVGEKHEKNIVVNLKYTEDGKGVIEEMQRISRPSRRVYSSYQDLPKVRNGLGVVVVSTSKGLLTDQAARQQKIGGELVLQIW